MRQGFHPAPFLYFNSQPHEEADNLCPSKRNVPRHFNSQPHEEADDGRVAVCQPDRISTHSLTKRLTELLIDGKCPNEYFNSQPHEEADMAVLMEQYLLSHFNSQPHEEADSR